MRRNDRLHLSRLCVTYTPPHWGGDFFGVGASSRPSGSFPHRPQKNRQQQNQKHQTQGQHPLRLTTSVRVTLRLECSDNGETPPLMTEETDLRELNLPGIQLAVFELIWGNFSWLHAIWIDVQKKRLTVFAVTSDPQIVSSKERESFCRLMQEIFDIAFEGQNVVIAFSIAPVDQMPLGTEVMSKEIFLAMAKEIAPWRISPSA